MKKSGRPRKDISGQRFGFLVAKKYVRSEGYCTVMWECVCDCGNIHEASRANLERGSVKSCGCKRKELIGNASRKHGMWGTRPWRIWEGMRRRCREVSHKDYPRYGGAGVDYNDSWNDFSVFWNDMENGYDDNLTLDRIDGTKGYSKENCRWATYERQAANRTDNRRYRGMLLTHIGPKLGGTRGLVHNRLRAGWSLKAACTTPVIDTGGRLHRNKKPH